jgi:small subunit ribosomal protein S1
MSEEMNTTPSAIDQLEVGAEVTGKVKRIELYGAFVDIGIGQDALLHVSQLGKPNVKNVEDVIQVGQELPLYILRIDKAQNRIALSVNKPVATPWEDLAVGKQLVGKVVKVESYGVFVEIGAERPGMIHVSELASGYVKSAADVAKVGDELKAQVIKIDRKMRRIDLSVKAMEEKPPTRAEMEAEEPAERMPTAMELALRRAMKEDGTAAATSGRTESKADRRQKEAKQLEDIISRTIKHHQS